MCSVRTATIIIGTAECFHDFVSWASIACRFFHNFYLLSMQKLIHLILIKLDYSNSIDIRLDGIHELNRLSPLQTKKVWFNLLNPVMVIIFLVFIKRIRYSSIITFIKINFGFFVLGMLLGLLVVWLILQWIIFWASLHKKQINVYLSTEKMLELICLFISQR